VGAAETLIASGKGFRLQGRTGAFSLRREPEHETLRPGSVPPQPRPTPVSMPVVAPLRPTLAPPLATTVNATATAPARRAASVKRVAPDLLGEAQRLADGGQVDQARLLCEKLIETSPSAPAYFLLGVLCRATQKGSPAEQFTRAIYLDPTHVDALNHLALEKDREGDREAATRLRDRARRATGQRGSK
jgi:chemotaxis protein methyltransferase WspC